MRVRPVMFGALAICVAANVRLLLVPYNATADRTAPWAIAACVGALVLAMCAPPPAWSRLFLGTGLALLVVAVAMPPRQSDDLWSYSMYGRIVTAGHANPYRVDPATFANDPKVGGAQAGWQNTRSVYGPLFTATSAAVVTAAGSSSTRARLGFQGLAAAAVAFVLYTLHRRRKTRVLAVTALHPIVVVSIVNGGHADALIGALLVATTILLVRERIAWATLCGTAALLVKADALIPLAAIGVACVLRIGARRTLPAALAMAAGTATAYALVGGTAALRPMIEVAGRTSRASSWQLINDGTTHGLSRLALLMVLVAGPGLVVVGSRLAHGPAAVAGVAALTFVLGAPYVLPWYVALALPLVVSDSAESVMGAVLLADSTLLFVAYQYHRVVTRDGLDHFLQQAVKATRVAGFVGLGVLVVAAGSELALRLRRRLVLRNL